MKKKIKKSENLNVRVEQEDCRIIKNLQEKYAINISAFIRNCLKEKYKELELK